MREDPRYLDWVREQPCAGCWPNMVPAEPHHFIGELGVGGVGMRAPDVLAMPLCRPHHEAIHQAVGGWKQLQREWLVWTLVRAALDGVLASTREDERP